MRSKIIGLALALAVGIAGAGMTAATAADWSTTEFHFQYGELDNAFAPGSQDTFIWTLQHASGWKYGDNFFFVDLLMPDDDNLDAYAEIYLNLSLGKISGNDLSVGPIRDFGILGGMNYAADANVRVWLPGLRLSWDLPGFKFANTDFMAYLTDNSGGEGAAPREDDSWMVDFNFATKQWEIGPTKWNIEGHIEYVAARDNEFGRTKEWILGQPQLRLDLGALIGLDSDMLFAGIEYQFWFNKLGGDRDESAVQALVVWRL